MLARQADEIARYMSVVAVTRIGGRGAQGHVGNLTLQMAKIPGWTSREGDPHRHLHLLVSARVQTPDGSWHGLHSAAMLQHIGAIHERAGRVLATDVALRDVLASQGYTVGSDAEIDQARQALALLSKRAGMVALNSDRAEKAWREKSPGSEPSPRVRNGWRQQGWEQSRKPRASGSETTEELCERVRFELAGAGFDFTPGARARVDWVGMPIAQVERDAVASDAVAVLSANKSAWSEADLTAHVEAALARTGVVGDVHAVNELAGDCRSRARQRCLSILDPDVHPPTAMSRHLSSQAALEAAMNLNPESSGPAIEGVGDPGDLDRFVLAGVTRGNRETPSPPGGTESTPQHVGSAVRVQPKGPRLKEIQAVEPDLGH